MNKKERVHPVVPPMAAMETEPDESDLPLSSSSAMPDLTGSAVPRLRAKVHRQWPSRKPWWFDRVNLVVLSCFAQVFWGSDISWIRVKFM